MFMVALNETVFLSRLFVDAGCIGDEKCRLFV